MSVAQNKRKGYQFEFDCVEFIEPEYPDAKRNGNIYGPKDRGDIGGVTDWTLQCKDVKTVAWKKWFAATVGQSINNKTRWWAVIRKERGKAIREALFCMPLWKGLELMTYLRDLEAENQRLKAAIGDHDD